MKKIILRVLLLLVLGHVGKAQTFQEIGVGGALILNTAITEPGIGFRSHMHFNDYFFLAPQISYFPGLANVHELFAGASINVKLWPSNNWSFYPTAAAFYNLYINYTSSASSKAALHNFNFEGGAGITKNFGCYRPYLEYRVNSKWVESNFRAGLIFYFGNCKKSSKQICPAFTLK